MARTTYPRNRSAAFWLAEQDLDSFGNESAYELFAPVTRSPRVRRFALEQEDC